MAHVKMEGALVVASQVGGGDTSPQGSPGLGEDNGGLCEAARQQSPGSQGPFSQVCKR